MIFWFFFLVCDTQLEISREAVFIVPRPASQRYILRNYGTFREPSFLAIWTVPFLPYFFYMGKTKKIWYVWLWGDMLDRMAFL